jgi:hypothetical protein
LDAPARSKDSRDTSRESLNASRESLKFFGESPIHLRDSLVVFGESIFAMGESLQLLFTIFEQEHAESANRVAFEAGNWQLRSAFILKAAGRRTSCPPNPGPT